MPCLKCFVLLTVGVFCVQASFAPGELFEVQWSNIVVEEFNYQPTREGYRFGYTLPDGTRRNEMGTLLHGGSSQQDLVAANNYARNDRPTRRPGVKNRKLSPKSLQSLAG